MGIISTTPGITLGSIDRANSTSDNRAVALSGRVPVKIASDSGEIHVGDYLTSSSTPGRAMKATKAGYIVAKALEDWSPDSGKESIMVFVNLGYYMGSMTADGYIDTGNSFVVENIKINTDQSLINRILGLMTNSSEDISDNEASDSGEVATGSAELLTSKGSLDITQAFEKILSRLEVAEEDISLLKTNDLISFGSTESASLSDNYNLLTTSDLVVTGGINVGTLGLTSGSIDSIGTLKIQESALGNIELLGGLIELSKEGGIKLSGDGQRPECNSGTRGTIWFDKANEGAEDYLEICKKKSDETFEWARLVN